jgi:hypothetical protein
MVRVHTFSDHRDRHGPHDPTTRPTTTTTTTTRSVTTTTPVEQARPRIGPNQPRRR